MLGDILVYGLFMLSAIFFVVFTKKCFFEKMSIAKMIVVFILSPAIWQCISFMFIGMMLPEDFLQKYEIALLAYIITGIQLVLQMLCMVIYIKVVKANTGAIAMFVYLCTIQIVPNIVIVLLDMKYYTIYGCFIVLHFLFYFLTIVPLSDFKNKKQFTDKKLFIILPVLTYVFQTVINGKIFYIMIVYQKTIKEFVRIDYHRLVSETDQKHFRQVLSYIDDMTYANVTDMLYPCIFVIAVLIIAFYVIVKNIKYKNEAVEAQNATKMLSVEVMEALAHTIDAKDEYTRGHSIRVAKYSRMIAEKMGLSQEQCENIYYMGLLHDIGKIGVPNEIINKPSHLTEEEYNIIKTHPMTGFEILDEIKSRPDLAIGARWHHEKYDGTGYPDQKSGEQIPLEARIIAVADSYDAMTSNRSYRKYLPQDTVREEIEKNIGIQFDENCARCMLAIINEDKAYLLHE